MRIIKLILIILLVLVTLVFGVTGLRERMSKAGEGPVIACETPLLEVSVMDDRDVLLSGVTATDDRDGDLTGEIIIQGISKLIDENTTKITYIVFDSDGNLASATRELRYRDYHSPRFEVTEALRYVSGASVALLDRLKVADLLDGDITDKVRVSGLNPTDEAEIYTVDLQVTNSLGDTARISLPVVVTSGNSSRPTIDLRQHLVYLSAGDAFSPRQYLRDVTSLDSGITIEDVDISGMVDTSTPGTYLVHYRCSDSFGTGIAVLTVVVEEGGRNG